MRLVKLLLVLILLVVLAFATWYFRPWSDYSPAKIAALEVPARYAENFRSMETIVPAKVVAKGQNITVLASQLGDLPISYEVNGQQKLLETYLTESATTGLLIVKNGAIRHEQYYLGANQESLLTSWSVAKSFVATVIIMAQHEGLIESLDDKAEKYAPQYAGSDFGSSSLKSLLAMSSGIEFNEDYVSDDSDVRPFFFNSFILGKNPDQLLAGFKRSRPAFTDFHYISPNSHVLSAVLRGVYKKPLASIMSDKIWQPLGMEADASWLQNRSDERGIALGYCCLNARLRDYARFGQFYLDAVNGRGLGVDLLPSSWLESLPKPATPSHKPGGENYAGRGYSYHFWLPQRQGVFFASGVYGQAIWIDPERELVIVKTSADNEFLKRFPETEVAFEAISRFYD